MGVGTASDCRPTLGDVRERRGGTGGGGGWGTTRKPRRRGRGGERGGKGERECVRRGHAVRAAPPPPLGNPYVTTTLYVTASLTKTFYSSCLFGRAGGARLSSGWSRAGVLSADAVWPFARRAAASIPFCFFVYLRQSLGDGQRHGHFSCCKSPSRCLWGRGHIVTLSSCLATTKVILFAEVRLL